jgi:uncharacterized membrane protein
MTSESSSAGSSKAAGEGHLRSLVKAATWRATGTIDTFILSFLFTKSVKLASSIAFTEVVTKIGLFYLHERVWNRISWGPCRAGPATGRACGVPAGAGRREELEDGPAAGAPHPSPGEPATRR